MQINIIAAVARNRAIGNGNKLIYWLPDDLKRFKSLTTGNTIIMGRNTYLSLPKGALPNRRNIVLSRKEGAAFAGAEVFPSLEAALAACGADEQVFVIGGYSVYRDALPLADRLALTEVDAAAEHVDTYFPAFDAAEWQLAARESFPADAQNEQPYAFADYVRKS